MATATATARPKSAPNTTCRRCGSRNLEQRGDVTRREIAGFDERENVHYEAIEWMHLRCRDCHQCQSKRVLIEAKRRPKPPAKPKPRRQAAHASAEVCAKSAPTLRKIDHIPAEESAPLVSIPGTTHVSQYSSSDPPDNVDEQRRQDPRNKRNTRRRRD
jgi:hypothetical protein